MLTPLLALLLAKPHRFGALQCMGRYRRAALSTSSWATPALQAWALQERCFSQTAKTTGMILLLITAAFRSLQSCAASQSLRAPPTGRIADIHCSGVHET